MGILMLQREKKWRIEIRESWKISKLDVSDDLNDFLIRHQIKHSIDYTDTHIIYKFENSSVEFEEYKEFLITINQLFEYKRIHGQLQNG